MNLRSVAHKKEGENFALGSFRSAIRPKRVSRGFESRCFSSSQKRVTGHLDGHHTFHRALDARNRAAAGIIQNRPAFLEPVFCLFDGADFSFFSAFGDNERKGLSPIYFYHCSQMVILRPKYKFGKMHNESGHFA